MKKFAFFVVALLLFAKTASAQFEPTFPGCATCSIVIGYLDLPQPGTTISNAALLSHQQAIEGWGFRWFNSDPITRIDIYVEDDYQPNTFHPVKGATPSSSTDQTEGGSNPRPDVELAYVSIAPAIEGRWTGVVRWIDAPLPLGAHRYLFLLWSGPFHTQPIYKTLNVVQ